MLNYKKLSEEFTKVLNSKTKESIEEWIEMDKQRCLDEKEMKMKTSVQLKILSVLFEAQENGEVIEARPSTSDKWSICKLIDDNIHSSFYHPGLYEYRIKPKPKYRRLDWNELAELAINKTLIVPKDYNSNLYIGGEYVIGNLMPETNSVAFVNWCGDGSINLSFSVNIDKLVKDYKYKHNGLPVGKEINDK